MSKRFFAFGCSYTDYNWATWADLLCHHYHQEGYKVYNYGNSGMGNQHILDALIQADLKHNITDSDIVCVLWSSWAREDRLWNMPHRGKVHFSKLGSIAHAEEAANIPNYKLFADLFFNLEQYVMKTVTAVVAANRAFNISYQAHITSNEEYDEEDLNLGDELLKKFYLFSAENQFYDRTDMAYTQERLFWTRQIPNLDNNDGHPSPGTHMAFVKHKVAPALQIELNDDSVQWMKAQHKEVKAIENQWSPEIAKTYRGYLEPRKRKTLPFMKDWRDLWESEQSESDSSAGLQWGPVNNGVLSGLTRAIDQKKLR